MISLVVPTRNRAHTLRRVVRSYYEQEVVSEIIFISDAGEDDTAELVAEMARAYPATRTRFIRNPVRLGAAQSRNVGVGLVENEFTLFCDDDEHLEPGYARICRDKLLGLEAAAVSGRRVYMVEEETPQQAVQRFGSGLRRAKPFRRRICEYVNGAIFEGDIELPFTNSVILTRTALLRRFPFDGFYARGNGYREETDYQMNLYVNGYRIFVTNDCHSIHLPMSQVRTGGQRVNRLRRVFWAVRNTDYFFKRYFAAYSRPMGIATPRWAALALFSAFYVYRELMMAPLYGRLLPVALWLRGGPARA